MSLLAAVLGAGPVHAQAVYGRIRGTVTDSLGAAVGARVSLVGTAFAAVTDLHGRYAIERVPVGTYVLRAEGVSRPAGEVAGVRVSGDATVVVDAKLGRTRDASPAPAGATLSTGQALSGADLADLPIDDARQALGLLPGVVQRGSDRGIADVPSLSLRGSAADQTAVFVDGAPARFATLGIGQLALGADAIGEVGVVTGTSSATVADARGGAISYVTRAGGPRFEAGLAAITDGPFSRNATVGLNRFDAHAGGPVPSVARLTWFVSGAIYGQSSADRGRGADSIPTFAAAGIDTVVNYAVTNYATNQTNTYAAVVPRFAQVGGACGRLGGDSSAMARQIRSNYGLTCQGAQLDLNWSTSRRAQGKLLYTYGQGSSVSLTGVVADLQQRQNPGQDLADNLLFTGTRATSALAVLNWSHHLAEPLGGALTLSANLSLGSDATQSGPLDLASEAATVDPSLGIEFTRLRFAGLGGLPLPLTDAVIRQLRSGTFSAPLSGRNDLTTVQMFRFNPYGVSGGFPTGGLGGEVTVASESRADGRVEADWQAAPALAVSAGADFSRTDLSYYDAQLVSTAEPNAFTATPRRTGLFALGRFEQNGLTVEAGLRADRYVTGADFPTFPGRIYSNPVLRTSPDTSYAARMKLVMTSGRTQGFVTPHVRFGLRAGRHTDVWAGFSQQVEVPPYAMLFADVNSDLALTSGAQPIGRDVSYVTSTLVEGGVRHAFRAGWTVDASVYEKTNASPYAFIAQPVYDPFVGGDPSQANETLSLLGATSDSHVLGGDLRIGWAPDGPVGASASYSIVQRHLEVAAPAYPLITTFPDATTQSVAGALTVRGPDGNAGGSLLGAALRGWQAVLTGRATSGEPYTPLSSQAGGEIAPLSGIVAGAGSPVNLPWTWTVDLRIAKTVRAAGVRWTVYAEALNLFDAGNLVAAFAETGTARNEPFKSVTLLPQINQLEVDAGRAWVTKPVVVNGVLQNLQGVDLSNCSYFNQPADGSHGIPDCLALRQVEARFGNGDGFYDLNEINRALGAWYDATYGPQAFYGPGRTARIGVRVEF